MKHRIKRIKNKKVISIHGSARCVLINSISYSVRNPIDKYRRKLANIIHRTYLQQTADYLQNNPHSSGIMEEI